MLKGLGLWTYGMALRVEALAFALPLRFWLRLGYITARGDRLGRFSPKLGDVIPKRKFMKVS